MCAAITQSLGLDTRCAQSATAVVMLSMLCSVLGDGNESLSFLAHTELGTCRASLVSPEHFVPFLPWNIAMYTVNALLSGPQWRSRFWLCMGKIVWKNKNRHNTNWQMGTNRLWSNPGWWKQDWMMKPGLGEAQTWRYGIWCCWVYLPCHAGHF